MKSRSPILGYNHNVRYAGRLWHVQTEDSGVQNPHIFTHLFSDGTILATKRLDYDPASELTAVQKLMQTQHKAMLRELKAGSYDDKIAKFFGEPVDKGREEESTDPNARPPLNTDTEERLATPVDVPQFTEADLPDLEPPPAPAPEPPPAAPVRQPGTTTSPRLPSQPSQPIVSPARSPTPGLGGRKSPQIVEVVRSRTPHPGSEPDIPAAAAARTPAVQPPRANPPPTGRHPIVAPQRPVAQPLRPATGVSGIGGRRQMSGTAYATQKPSAEGVVMARPAVIIGGSSQPDATNPRTQLPERRVSGTGQHKAAQPAPPKQPPPPVENIFGGDLISEKSLDEVILAYLSEDLNDK
jgi:hypothetical protein